MSESTETIVADPFEFMPDRKALAFDKLGLHVIEADWGDSEHELFLVKQLRGEIPADRHPPNRTAVIKLRANPKGTAPLAEVLQWLQQKVGIWQEEGGWIRRDMDIGGGFVESVAVPVLTAQLGGVGGWLMGHRQVANEIVLTLTIGPTFYGVNERVMSEQLEEVNTELVWVAKNISGSAPGLLRQRITNKDATEPWRTIISAIESRDYPGAATADTSAALVYKCPDLELLAGATKEEAGTTVQAILNAGWQAILGSKIVTGGVGHMTHKGPRHMWFSVKDMFGNLPELRIEYKPLGALQWTVGDVYTIPKVMAAEYTLCDLGVATIEKAVLGSQRWEWRLSARCRAGEGKIRVQKVYPMPAEQYIKMTTPEAQTSPEKSSDTSPGTMANDATVGTLAWTNPNNAKLSDNAYATAELVSTSESTQYLKATNYGKAIPEGATIVGILVGIEKNQAGAGGIYDAAVRIVKGGVIGAVEKAYSSAWQTADAYTWYGGAQDLWGQTWLPADINSANFGVVIAAKKNPPPKRTASIDHMKIIVYYTEAKEENRLCFAQRSVEIRSDGVFRQHPTDEVWGRIVPDEGGYPYAPPGYLEDRPARGIIIASFGDLVNVRGAGFGKYGYKMMYTPGYHFTAEAGASSYMQLYLKRVEELGLPYVIAPKTAKETLKNLGTLAETNEIGKPTLQSGAVATEEGLILGGAAVSQDGVDDFIAAEWKTRTNLWTNPTFETGALVAGGTNVGTTLGAVSWLTPESVVHEGLTFTGSDGPWVNQITMKKDATATLRTFTLSSTSNAGDVTGSQKYSFQMLLNVIKNTEKGVNIYFNWYNGESFLETKGVSALFTGTGIKKMELAGIEAPATANKVVMVLQGQSEVASKEVDIRVDCVMVEKSATVNTFGPTGEQFRSGVAGFAKAIGTGASDFGPMARGTRRTFILSMERKAGTVNYGLFGEGNNGLYGLGEEGKLTLRTGETPGSDTNWGYVLPLNTPTSIVLTYDQFAQTAELWINGASQGVKAIAKNFLPDASGFKIGFDLGLFNKGRVLPFALATRKLTSEEIEALYY